MLSFNYLLISLIACSQVALSSRFSNSSAYSEDNDSIASRDMLNNKFDSESLCGVNATSAIGCDENYHYQERKDGFSENYKLSCRNWSTYDYVCYGRKDIPYWINLNDINDKNKKELLISDIRNQANMWNLLKIEDTGENIVNFLK